MKNNNNFQDPNSLFEALSQLIHAKTQGQYPAFQLLFEEFINFLMLKDRDKYLAFLNYPKEVRKHIYTTNPVEGLNRGFELMRLD